MIFLIYFLLFTLTYTHKCSFNTPIKYEQIYLCREKLNSTSLRIWLHMKFNKTDQYELSLFSYYIFTLRVIGLADKHKNKIKDRFEKQISDYAEIDFHQKRNNTINIQGLLPGHYEICVNFLNKKNKKFYYRSSNSCLHIPWNVPETVKEHMLVLYFVFLILIIILFATIAFFVFAVHQYFKSRKPLPSPKLVFDEDIDNNERAKFLVHQHFVQDVNPFASSIRKRIHQRYAHRSPDHNDM